MMVGGGSDPLTARVVAVEDTADIREVTVEFTRTEALARFYEDRQVRARVAGHWQSPQPFPGACRSPSSSLFGRTNVREVVLELPVGSDAIRFSIGYRVGGSPYCRAYGFLGRHGLIKRFPNVSRTALKLVPRKPRFRCQVVELDIPPAFVAETRS